MPWNRRIKIAPLAFLFTLCLIIYIGFFLFNAFENDKKDDVLLTHSFDLVSTYRQLFSTVKDAESAQRGYIITNNPKFLEPLQKSVILKDSLLTRLATLVKGNRKQMDQLAAFEKLVSQKYTSINYTLVMNTEEGHQATEAYIMLGNGRKIMDAIRKSYALFDKQESNVLHQRILHSQLSHRKVKRILFIGIWAIIFFFVVVFSSIYKQLVRIKKNEELLFIQNEWHNQTLISMGDAVITTDLRGIITMLNNAATQITGWATKEAIGKSIPEVVVLNDALTGQSVQSELIRVLKEQKTLSLSKGILLSRKDNTRGYTEISGAPIRNKKGKIIGAVYILRDIDDRVKAEVVREEAAQEIDASRKKFYEILESNPVGIAITASDSRVFKYVNEAFCQLSGYTKETLLGHSAQEFDMIHHENRAARVKELAKNQGKARNIEAKFHKKDGTVIDVLFYVDTLELDGELCHSSNLIDITHKKQLEDKIVKLNQTLEKRVKARTEALEQQKNFTENILNKISTEIIVYDKNRKYLYVNPEGIADEVLRAWIIGKTDLDYCAFLDLDPSLAESRTLAFDAIKKQENYDWVDEIMMPDGSIKYMLRILHPVPNDDKYILTGYDITHIKQAAMAREEYTQNLEQMLDMTSHQVRHAVAQILGLKDVLFHDLSQAELQTVISYMNTAIDSLVTYTAELTEFIYEVRK